jgi:hypothetical protein
MVRKSQERLIFWDLLSIGKNSEKGYYVIKKKTARKRLNRFLRMLWNWCKGNRHDPIAVQYRILCNKLCGFYQYYGVRGNYKALEVAFEFLRKSLASVVEPT